MSFHFCYKAAGEPISNRIWTHAESTQDPKHEQTIDSEKLLMQYHPYALNQLKPCVATVKIS